MLVQINRSAEWVAARRLERGTNVPHSIEVHVDPAKFGTEARAIILRTGNSSYPAEKQPMNLCYTKDYEWGGCYSSFGSMEIMVNSDEPTLPEIEAEILRADAALTEKRTAAEQKRREKEEADRRLKEARELLGAEIAAKDAEIKELQAKRLTLAEFIARIPADAKRGTLKAMARDPEAVEALKDKVEAAAPGSIYVLNDVDTDEDEDEE